MWCCGRHLLQTTCSRGRSRWNPLQAGRSLAFMALILTEDINHTNICWKCKRTGCKQSRWFLECVEDNSMMQVIHEMTREDALQDLLLTEKEELIGDVKVKGSHGCSHHKMVEFKILRDVSKVNSRITALDFRRKTFGLFKDLLVGGKKAQRSFKEFSRKCVHLSVCLIVYIFFFFSIPEWVTKSLC